MGGKHFPNDGTFKYMRIIAGGYSVHTETNSVSYPSAGKMSHAQKYVQLLGAFAILRTASLRPSTRTEHLGSLRMDIQEA